VHETHEQMSLTRTCNGWISSRCDCSRIGRIAFINGPDVYTMNPNGSDLKQLTNLGLVAAHFGTPGFPMVSKSSSLNTWRILLAAPDIQAKKVAMR
jgi:hypothetical protein